ncbi:hybrid sensor histidine kinase/response regulator [Parafrankia soli]|uniref:histidine kinase n=1 Tax=Parafrankia soli TaxID=2599596 RepID=A0A1S1PIN9_9ACTN|nr:HAMP domain-containing sensor histidine kinase [Parafrankia soli]OHV22733.1 hybrid sensor histidine kinase/response regulator [Parafrankia soli]CAI7978724.1 Hybrid sensor histidine kinase/response regulator [Frankia sp. Hr75.2]
MGLSTLLDTLTDLVVVVGGDGRVLELGAAARAFVGDRIGTAPHLHDLSDVVDPACRVELAGPVSQALARTGVWRGTVSLIDLAGTTAPYTVTARLDPAGGMVIVARDTVDARARRAAETESRSKDEFVARLGHELRTPLNAMLGFAQLLELEPLTPDLHEDVERIITGGRHMQALIDDVLDLARLRAGRGDINKGPVNVLDIVQGVVELVEPLAERRGIRRIIHPARPLIADADRRRLWQVLLNLVGNALKYGREGGNVRVGVVPVTGSRIRIEVEDDGIGLSPSALSRLFRPFERLGAEDTGVEGSGLGLALSHALVTAMGGVLTVASRPGVGSVFAVVLDAVDVRYDHTEDDPDDFMGDGQLEPGGLRVVHVSGDPGLRALVSDTLASALGADTISVPRGALAVEAIRRARPSLVLLDRDLPDVTAVDLLPRLAADPVAGTVPALVLTTEVDPDEWTRLRRAGAVQVLGMPLDVTSLIAATSQLTTA